MGPRSAVVLACLLLCALRARAAAPQRPFVSSPVKGPTQGAAVEHDGSVIQLSSSSDESWPEDFDAAAYLAYNPDCAKLFAHMTETRRTEAAYEHYQAYGYKERRIYKRVHVILGYVSYGGLTNQVYGHANAMTLAATLGASIIIPPSVARNGFDKVQHSHAAGDRLRYHYSPFGELFDEGRIVKYLEGRGVTPRVLPPELARGLSKRFNDLHRLQPRALNQHHLQHAQQLFQLGNASRVRVVGLQQPLFAKGVRLQAAVDNITRLVLREASLGAARLGSYRTEPPTVVVNLMWPMLGLALNEVPLAADVVRHLGFSGKVQRLAAAVQEAIAKQPAAGGAAAEGEGRGAGAGAAPAVRYNGLHLRLERDAKAWQGMVGGTQTVLQGYVAQCHTEGFDASMPAYVASGLLSYGSDAWPAARRQLLGGCASALYYKERFLTWEQLEGLSSEQRAAVDFLVMAGSRSFVGFSASTFSWLLREYRLLWGIAGRDTTRMAHAGKVGNAPLFKRAAMLAL